LTVDDSGVEVDSGVVEWFVEREFS